MGKDARCVDGCEGEHKERQEGFASTQTHAPACVLSEERQHSKETRDCAHTHTHTTHTHTPHTHTHHAHTHIHSPHAHRRRVCMRGTLLPSPTSLHVSLCVHACRQGRGGSGTHLNQKETRGTGFFPLAPPHLLCVRAGRADNGRAATEIRCELFQIFPV